MALLSPGCEKENLSLSLMRGRLSLAAIWARMETPLPYGLWKGSSQTEIRKNEVECESTEGKRGQTYAKESRMSSKMWVRVWL